MAVKMSNVVIKSKSYNVMQLHKLC